jgi:hypothetical protein
MQPVLAGEPYYHTPRQLSPGQPTPKLHLSAGIVPERAAALLRRPEQVCQRLRRCCWPEGGQPLEGHLRMAGVSRAHHAL